MAKSAEYQPSDPAFQALDSSRTFPFGVDVKSARTLEELITAARGAGRAGDVTISLIDSDRDCHVSADCFRQESATLLLVRLSPPTRAKNRRWMRARRGAFAR